MNPQDSDLDAQPRPPLSDLTSRLLNEPSEDLPTTPEILDSDTNQADPQETDELTQNQLQTQQTRVPHQDMNGHPTTATFTSASAHPGVVSAQFQYTQTAPMYRPPMSGTTRTYQPPMHRSLTSLPTLSPRREHRAHNMLYGIRPMSPTGQTLPSGSLPDANDTRGGRPPPTHTWQNLAITRHAHQVQPETSLALALNITESKLQTPLYIFNC